MSAFDPYHVWLGIPPEEQPPNYYRLLGIAPFESNADVIATAADRQMMHLRTFQSGKRSDLSQQLLNEVATAKVCLLNPAKKAAYDEQLRGPSPAAANPSPWSDYTDFAPQPVRTPITKRRRKNIGPAIGVVVAVVFTAAILLVWNATKNSSPQTTVASAVDEPPIHEPVVHTPIPKTPVPSKEPENPAVLKVESTAPAPPIASAPPETPVAKSDERPTFEKPTAPSFEAPKDEPKDTPEKRRLPVPDEDVQQKIAEQIDGIYGRAKTPAERIKLTYQLLQAAKASKEPNERYVLLSQGRELAVQAGEMALALQIIEATAEFDIDVQAEQVKALRAVGEKLKPEQIGAFYTDSQRLIAQALSADRCELAADMANIVYRACQRSKDFRKKALDQRDRVQAYCRRQEQRREAEVKLKANPDDADAHLALGRHYCFDDDWPKALSHFAKGSDAELRELAERDAASPTATAAQIKLADAWWALGNVRQKEDRDSLLLRAGYWYDRAHEKLTSGLERLKVEKRLEELTEVRQRRAADLHRLHPDKDAPQDLWNGLY